jgi:hypothetical protein
MPDHKELISEDSLSDVEEAAPAEQRSVWQKLVKSGSHRADTKGLTEDDVPRLVAEARRDRQR